MTRISAIAAVLAVSLGGVGVAQAAPLAPLSVNATSAVIQVAQGCGRGWARGPLGNCQPMVGYRAAPLVVLPAPVIVRPARICPPGFIWRYGRCRPF